jgi:hypothetical protein
MDGRDPMSIPRAELVNVSDAVPLLDDMSKKNIGPWLKRHGVEPVRVDPHPVGRLYLRSEVKSAGRAWLKVRDRGSDMKRRDAALTNYYGGTN